MKLEFSTRIATLTITTHPDVERVLSLHELADLGEALQKTVEPYAAHVMKKSRALEIEQLKRQLAHPSLTQTGRHRLERRLAILKGPSHPDSQEAPLEPVGEPSQSLSDESPSAVTAAGRVGLSANPESPEASELEGGPL